jgi:hypothetical protein
MKTLKLAAVSTLLLYALPSMAAQTNLVQNISIVAKTISQGGSVTNGTLVTTGVNKGLLTTANIIQTLGASTGDSFASTAKLLLVSPLPSGSASIVVRDGTNEVDVTGFFVDQIRSDTMEGSVLDTSTGKMKATDYDIQRFQLVDQGGFPNLDTHFDARGVTVTKSKTLVNGAGAVIGQAHQVLAVLAGDGDRNNTNVVMQVSIKILGGVIEVK